MRKFFLGIILSALCLTVSGCQGGAEEKTPTGFHPSGDAQTLLDSGAFSAPLTEVDQATACNLYGFDAASVTGCAVYGSTSNAEELAIFTLKDENAVQTAADQLQFRVEDRIDELSNYTPEEIPKLEHAMIAIRENAVLLVIAADYAPVENFLGK